MGFLQRLRRRNRKRRSAGKRRRVSWRALVDEFLATMGPLEWLAVAFIVYIFYRGLFAPSLPYEVARPLNLEDAQTIELLATIADAGLHKGNRLEVFSNGVSFYPAELEAIAAATASINIEAYIFIRGEIGGRFASELARKAQDGVKVNVLMDALGSWPMGIRRDLLNQMRGAGCKVFFYHPLSLNTLERMNIRTHRELVIVDGRIGFVGGAGIGDHWYKGVDGNPAWRDTMVRLEGPAVLGLQGMFVENWLESSGEILTGPDYFPVVKPVGDIAALVANSSSKGRSTHARILFQVLLASAKKNIYITTPYFLPDAAVRRELLEARQRGVVVKAVVPSDKIDHLITRAASRRMYGELLREGVEIYEYQPAMLHTKMLLIDGAWAVIGTTNFDHRSFSINDEVNVVVPSVAVHEKLERDFLKDTEQSRRITLERWNRRPLTERAMELLGRLSERQQ